ncbi:MAG TPA: uracil-DNA glycosylase [Gammaproteobacteria bacterium]|jgi:DNA polymerase
MDERQRHYLGVMGIQVWEQRAAVPAGEQGEGNKEQGTRLQEEKPGNLEPCTLNLVPENDVAALDWPLLRERVAECRSCEELAASRTQTVFGVGNPNADWLVIGEAPGAEEDRQGEPFVGRAGQLLNAMLAAVGLARERVYIANVLKCRPPNNRDPKAEEAAACRGFLQRQIALIQPRLILVVGRIAAQNLLDTDAPLGTLRGKVHRLESGVPVVVTYHPAYLLRSPQEKRKAWADLCLARATVQDAAEQAR